MEEVLTYLDIVLVPFYLVTILLLSSRIKSKNISSNVNETWSEKNILLITYADNVNNGLVGNTLNDFILFYNKYFFEFIDTIHFLPFFPSSGDGGFAVKNHEEIDPVFGDWEQIKELSKYTNIMTDLVLNHASSEGKWFKNFISGKSPGKDYFFTIDNNYDYSHVIRPRDHDLIKKIKILNDTKNLWCTFSYDQFEF